MTDKLYAAIFLLMVIGATIGLMFWLDARIELKLRAGQPHPRLLRPRPRCSSRGRRSIRCWT